MKRTILLTFIFVCASVFAQTNETTDSQPVWKMTANIQYVTQHFWRGLGAGPLFGDAPAFEPSVSLSSSRWNMGVFAGGSFDGVYKTVMPWISYSPVKNLWIGVWDMYSPGKKLWTSEAKPFDFGLTTSNHFVDLVVSYQLPWVPLSMKWATIFAGKDPNADGKRNYTSYAELSYLQRWGNFSAWGGIGVTPWKGLYHGKKGGVNNLELKLQYNFNLYKPVTLPVFTKIAYNPLADKFHFVMGANLLIPYTF